MGGIGEAIRLARRQRGWDQRQLAEAVGVGQTAVSSWENSQRTPDFATIQKLERVLGLSFSAEGLSPEAALLVGEAIGRFGELAELAAMMHTRAQAAADDLRDRAKMPATPMPPDLTAQARGKEALASLDAARAPRAGAATARQSRRGGSR